MKKLKAIIVDDEHLARQVLITQLMAFEAIDVVAECANGFEAVKAVQQYEPDVLFLDIQMPKLDGFEVLELLERDAMSVVFVTAYEQWAIKAFDANAVDYLLKPFAKERLQETVERLVAIEQRKVPDLATIQASAHDIGEFLSRIVVKDGNRISVIPIEEVLYVGAEDDYICIYTNDDSVLKHQTLSSLEKSLDPGRFVRIHRSTLVNIDSVKNIELMAKDKYVAILKNDIELNISRSGHRRLKEVMK